MHSWLRLSSRRPHRRCASRRQELAPHAWRALEERQSVGTPGHRSFALGERRVAQGEVVTEPMYAGFTKSAEEPDGAGGVCLSSRLRAKKSQNCPASCEKKPQ